MQDSRKIIKNLFYNFKILPFSLRERININKDYLDNIQDLIGRWHDTDVTLRLLIKRGTVEGEVLPLSLNKKEQLEAIVNETRGFDEKVMFSKQHELIISKSLFYHLLNKGQKMLRGYFLNGFYCSILRKTDFLLS